MCAVIRPSRPVAPGDPAMHDLSHARQYNRARTPAVRATRAALPARTAGVAKPGALAAVIPALPNAAGLPAAVAMASSLPRESSPRIMNLADVPLTDASRFVRRL